MGDLVAKGRQPGSAIERVGYVCGLFLAGSHIGLAEEVAHHRSSAFAGGSEYPRRSFRFSGGKSIHGGEAIAACSVCGSRSLCSRLAPGASDSGNRDGSTRRKCPVAHLRFWRFRDSRHSRRGNGEPTARRPALASRNDGRGYSGLCIHTVGCRGHIRRTGRRTGAARFCCSSIHGTRWRSLDYGGRGLFDDGYYERPDADGAACDIRLGPKPPVATLVRRRPPSVPHPLFFHPVFGRCLVGLGSVGDLRSTCWARSYCSVTPIYCDLPSCGEASQGDGLRPVPVSTSWKAYDTAARGGSLCRPAASKQSNTGILGGRRSGDRSTLLAGESIWRGDERFNRCGRSVSWRCFQAYPSPHHPPSSSALSLLQAGSPNRRDGFAEIFPRRRQLHWSLQQKSAATGSSLPDVRALCR